MSDETDRRWTCEGCGEKFVGDEAALAHCDAAGHSLALGSEELERLAERGAGPIAVRTPNGDLFYAAVADLAGVRLEPRPRAQPVKTLVRGLLDFVTLTFPAYVAIVVVNVVWWLAGRDGAPLWASLGTGFVAMLACAHAADQVRRQERGR